MQVTSKKPTDFEVGLQCSASQWQPVAHLAAETSMPACHGTTPIHSCEFLACGKAASVRSETLLSIHSVTRSKRTSTLRRAAFDCAIASSMQ
jgi:hypothetical protein